MKFASLIYHFSAVVPKVFKNRKKFNDVLVQPLSSSYKRKFFNVFLIGGANDKFVKILRILNIFISYLFPTKRNNLN